MESNYSLSDIAAVTDGGISGGMGGWWMIILFALIFGNGGGVFGGVNRAATVDDVAGGFNFAGINNKLNEITSGIAGVNQNLGNAICSSTYELASKIDQCCCNTQLGIQGVKFDMANYASSIQMNDTANTQKVLDKLCQMEMANKDAVIAQQGQRIAALEADARMCGVLRWPTSATYAVGCNPFFNGCGYSSCNNI